MEEPNQSKQCYNAGIRLLSRRDYSAYKMSQKLKEKGYSEDTIAETIEKLIEQNYLREEEYKRIRIKTLIVKGHSNNYIQQKCSQEKLDVTNDEIEEIKNQYQYTTSSMINDLIQKKIRYTDIPSDYEQKQKLKKQSSTLSNFKRSPL